MLKSKKKDNKSFTALVLLWIGKPKKNKQKKKKQAQVSLPQWSMLFLNVPNLKVRIIIIILPTDQPEIILLTAHTTKN